MNQWSTLAATHIWPLTPVITIGQLAYKPTEFPD